MIADQLYLAAWYYLHWARLEARSWVYLQRPEWSAWTDPALDTLSVAAWPISWSLLTLAIAYGRTLWRSRP